MKPTSIVQCLDFPCLDTRQESYIVPGIEVDPIRVSVLLISEAAPENPADYYYAGKAPSSPKPPCWPSRMRGRRCSPWRIFSTLAFT